MSFSAGNLIVEQTSSPRLPSLSTAFPVANTSCLNPIREKKQSKMPKRKADVWPNSILTDPDVLSLDDEGRFVLCKVCHVHYAVHGGKKPKPVIMNSGFRTRAWEVHKERTNSHRLEKNRGQERTQTPNPKLSLPPPPPPQPPSRQVQEDIHRSAPPPPPPPPVQATQAVVLPSTASRNLPTTTEETQPQSQGGIRWANKHRLSMHHHPPDPSSQRINSTSSHAKSNAHQPMTMEQMDGLMRWRNMHDDVSRALGSPRYKITLPGQQRGVEIHEPKPPLAEAEDFNGNNEKVAKKLKSLNAEYDAKILRRPEVFCDRRSDAYKQYWGTLRDVYNAQAIASPASYNESTSTRKKTIPTARTKPDPDYNKDVDLTTPDDTGSSESITKPSVVHDQALINAIDRLTGVISKQFSQGATTRHSMMMESMHRLTQSVDDMRTQQNDALTRLVHLQEQKVQLMQAMLQHKLQKNNHNSMSE